MKEKRTRGQNFSPQEEDILVSLVEHFKEIIETKKTDGCTSKQKNETWESIQKQFCGYTDTYRTAKMLREKYENMKKKAKTIMASQKHGLYLDRGTACSCSQVRTATINRLVDLIGVTNTAVEHNFEGNSNERISKEAKERISNDATSSCKESKVKCKTELLDEDNTEQYEPVVQIANTTEVPMLHYTDLPTCQAFSTKTKRSAKQSVLKKCKVLNYDTASVRAAKAQKVFYENEEKRAAERHLWEKELNEKRKMWEEELKNKKIELLNIQIENARRELNARYNELCIPNQLPVQCPPPNESSVTRANIANSAESFPWPETLTTRELSPQQEQYL